MININLAVKPAPRFRWRQAAAGALAGAALLSLAAYAALWWAELEQVNRDLAQVRALEAIYRNSLSQGGNSKEQEALLARQEERLAAITRNQRPDGPSTVLQAILAAAPPGVTLSRVAAEGEQALLIAGQAPSFDAAIAYLKALQQVERLASVQERKLESRAGGVTTFTFAALREDAP